MQKSEESGQNLDPMFFWRYVKGYDDRLPCILIKGDISDGLKNFVKHYPQINIIIEDGSIAPELKNVLYRERIRLTNREWLRGLSTIDYLVCSIKDKEYWLSAALCGVKVIFEDKDWVGEAIHVRSYLERIETWEWAKTLLTE